MKSFSIKRPTYKAAFILFLMIAILLCGILIERHLIQKVDTATTGLYEDRLMPATFVYQLTDLIHQRFRLAEKTYLAGQTELTPVQTEELSLYHQRTEVVILAFKNTYLVKDESASLDRLVAELEQYKRVEREVLQAPAGSAKLPLLEARLDAIRTELLQLGSIQVTVGKEMLADAEHVVANANALNKFHIAILIVCCLIAQVLILNSKVVRTPIRQNASMN